jgi:SAM-dependent methyltransferase
MSLQMEASGKTDCNPHTDSMIQHIEPVRKILEQPESKISLHEVEEWAAQFNLRLQTLDAENFGDRLEKAMFEIGRAKNVHSMNVELGGKLLFDEQSVSQATQTMIKHGITSIEYMLSFAFASQLEYELQSTRTAIAKAISGKHPEVSPLSLPGKTDSHRENNHTFLLQNTWLNYLRLPGILRAIDYDELHRRGMYRFRFAKAPTNFALEMMSYRDGSKRNSKIIEGKNILTLGPGRGRDEEHMLVHGNAASVEVVEGSSYMLEKLNKTKNGLPSNKKQRFHIPHKPLSMVTQLEQYARQGVRFDTIYCHSALHYFDDEILDQMLKNMRVCLNPNGHVAIAVKAPGAVLDGKGILVTNDADIMMSAHRGEEFDEERAIQRMWLNYDGQTRVFRDKAIWKKHLEQHFAVPRVTEHDIERYETDEQRPQKFYYFVCKKIGSFRKK